MGIGDSCGWQQQRRDVMCTRRLENALAPFKGGHRRASNACRCTDHRCVALPHSWRRVSPAREASKQRGIFCCLRSHFWPIVCRLYFRNSHGYSVEPRVLVGIYTADIICLGATARSVLWEKRHVVREEPRKRSRASAAFQCHRVIIEGEAWDAQADYRL